MSRTLSIEQRIRRQLERLTPMRLQSEGAPDPTDRALAQTALARHRTGAPVRRIARRRLQGQRDHALHRGIGDDPRCPGPRLIRAIRRAASRQKRLRHLPTVCLVMRSSRATAVLVFPAAQPKIRRARRAVACAVIGRRAQFSSVPRCTQHQLRDRSTESVHTHSPFHSENACGPYSCSGDSLMSILLN
jgi:hypothetical protein